MSDFRKLSDTVWASPQIEISDVGVFGFESSSLDIFTKVVAVKEIGHPIELRVPIMGNRREFLVHGADLLMSPHVLC